MKYQNAIQKDGVHDHDHDHVHARDHQHVHVHELGLVQKFDQFEHWKLERH